MTQELVERPKMSPEQAKFISDSIVDLLPENPHNALAVLALTFANVIVATECPEDEAFEALRRALKQMRSADRSREPERHRA